MCVNVKLVEGDVGPFKGRRGFKLCILFFKYILKCCFV
jgi:hypothetical protein